MIFGTGVGGIQSFEDGASVLAERGPEWVSPYTLPMMIPNMVAGEVAMEWGIRGYSSCTSTACSASAQAIGEGLDLIRAGRADAVVCGGTEAPITRVGIAGFAAMKALSTRNDDPAAASRPFDAGRDGFVMGEGSAVLVLEEREMALRRGAPILAELAGYGATSDAHHMTQPHPEGDGAVRAMRLACQDAGLPAGRHRLRQRPRDVHPPQRSGRDAGVEALLWGKGPPGVVHQVHDRAYPWRRRVPWNPSSASRSSTIRSCRRPSTRSSQTRTATWTTSPTRPGRRRSHVAMTNSFAFGGHNATLIFRRP